MFTKCLLEVPVHIRFIIACCIGVTEIAQTVVVTVTECRWAVRRAVTGEGSATQTATSCLLATSHTMSPRRSSKPSLKVCVLSCWSLSLNDLFRVIDIHTYLIQTRYVNGYHNPNRISLLNTRILK